VLLECICYLEVFEKSKPGVKYTDELIVAISEDEYAYILSRRVYCATISKHTHTSR
jgi:hypothetical protein